ncbi:MAG TPA: CDP-alcohol phosphatidyltransferase family protein [Candidatus Polarisedimenticolia bacterium]|nr:CDP-alcohol phosphatidyltransferase family protein [Candidatus Polarisedimenticolia bacterium]
MALYDVKPRFRALLSGLMPALRSISPDAITLMGLLFSLAAAVLFQMVEGARWAFLVIPVLLLLRIVCNALDGMVAQATGKARAFGEVLNELTDRLSDVAILLGLGFSTLSSPAWGIAACVAVLLSSYVGVLGKAVGAGRQYGGVLGKADRMLYLGLACVAAYFAGNPILVRTEDVSLRLFDLLLVAFAALGLVTTIQRVSAIHRALTPASRA